MSAGASSRAIKGGKQQKDRFAEKGKLTLGESVTYGSHLSGAAMAGDSAGVAGLHVQVAPREARRRSARHALRRTFC